MIKFTTCKQRNFEECKCKSHLYILHLILNFIYYCYLILYEHVEKFVTRFTWTTCLTQVIHIVLCYPDAQAVPYTGSLVIQSAALGTGYQVKELLCLGKRDEGGGSRK